jgi:hypothetical protein
MLGNKVLKKGRAAAEPELTSGDRQDIYRRLFLLNHYFHGIVLRLDELAGLLGRQDLRDMKGLTQEVQLEINNLLLDSLSSTEERDWEKFGRVRAALERRLKEPPGKRKK